MNLIKRILKRKTLIIILIIIFSLLGFIYSFNFTSLNKNNPPLSIVNTSKTIAEKGIPAHLKIPNINVYADVLSVGLTSGGAMEAPIGPREVGWYMFGPKPGYIGSAVIDGHSGWKDGIKAVFDDLYKLNKGDKIYVIDNDGETTIFIVREIKNYTSDEESLSVFNSNDDKSHLNLITCSGPWNDVEKSHSNRLIVFTEKE